MNPKKHYLSLDSRTTLTVTAVDDVISFDETAVTLAIGEATLDISGEDLSVKNLSLETGDVTIDGKINAVIYFDGPQRKKKIGLFGR